MLTDISEYQVRDLPTDIEKWVLMPPEELLRVTTVIETPLTYPQTHSAYEEPVGIVRNSQNWLQEYFYDELIWGRGGRIDRSRFHDHWSYRRFHEPVVSGLGVPFKPVGDSRLVQARLDAKTNRILDVRIGISNACVI